MKKYQIAIIFIVIIMLATALVYCSTYPFKEAIFEQKEKYRESDYVNAYCKGQIEYRLTDRTRVDCLTEEYAIEFDFAKKWAESIGQSLYYAKMTNKKPAVAIIVKSEKDKHYIERIKKIDKGITIFEIKAVDYKEDLPKPTKIKNPPSK